MIGSSSHTSRRLRLLARAIGRRCSGRVLIVGEGFPPLVERLRERGIEADCRSSGANDGGDRYDTVVLVRALEYRDPEDAPGDLAAAYARLDEGGALLVCVPNAGHTRDPGLRQRFDRRSLKRLLKTLDQPKVHTDQPFGWLLMALTTGTGIDRLTEERHRVIARLCRGSVLELGCAAGHLCRRIADRGLDVRGVDKNAGKIAKARRLFPGIEFEQADILKRADPRRYSTVVLAEVLEHVPADTGRAMLAAAWERVAPGGRLIVSVPNEDCVPHKNHLCEFTAAELKALLAPFGQPRVETEQPFKWLLMHVQRGD